MLKIRLQDLVDKKDPRICLVATQSRSGTWYNRYFFFGLDRLLRGENLDTSQLVSEFEKQKERFFVKDTLGVDYLLIGHATCPGFKEHYRGNFIEKWNELKFFGDGFAHNHLDNVLWQHKKLFDPYYNKNAKIVYFYRNPFDQAVSSFPRLQQHKFIQINYANEREFLHGASIDAFIKQFFTFFEMKKIFPDNILTITYEDLVKNPKDIFSRVLSHFGCKIENDEQKSNIKRAIELASIDNLKSVEQKMGRALGNDQIGLGESHFKGGGTIGKWKNYFSKEDIDKVQKRMTEFNLSLNELIIE